jgi:hypothetical protein
MVSAFFTALSLNCVNIIGHHLSEDSYKLKFSSTGYFVREAYIVTAQIMSGFRKVM